MSAQNRLFGHNDNQSMARYAHLDAHVLDSAEQIGATIERVIAA